MRQTQIIEAVCENGILRPLEPLKDLKERCKVKITIEYDNATSHPLAKFAGILSDDEAEELRNIIENEFEGINLNDW